MRNTLIASFVLLAACKGKPQHREPPPTVGSASTKTGSGERAAPDLQLPAGPGTPPLKTTRKLGRADFEKLATLDYPGFDKQQHGLNDVVFEMRQMTKDHPRLWATVTIEPCKDDCWPMDLATWKTHEADLKKLLGAFADDPSVDWEVGQTVVRGQPMIYTYQLGQRSGGANGGGGYTNAYALYYNDGTNKIRVVGEYKDDLTKGKEIMAKLAPKGDLELLAQAFMDVYTHAWPTS